MKTLILAFLISVPMFSGCTQWKKLTGDEPRDEGLNVAGTWRGTIDLGNGDENIRLFLMQNGSSIERNAIEYPYISIDYTGTLMATIRGSVSGNTVYMAFYGQPPSQCPNTFTMTGHVSGGTMLLTIDGDGVAVPGTTCYPGSIHQTIAMAPL